MANSLSRLVMAASVAFLAGTTLAPFAQATPKQPPACVETRIDYLGRVPVSIVDGVQFYRWSYRVTGTGCTNRSLSHVTLALCTQTQQNLSQVSKQSNDYSDAPGGVFTTYRPKVGTDRTTGLSGLKWNFSNGNPINKPGEWDEFGFVASGSETTLEWAAKGGQIITRGTTMGPACSPVPVETKSWSAIKALFHS